MARADDPAGRLAAVEEIKQLKARYFRCLDTHDWATFETLFTADARLEADGHVEDGRDAICSGVARALEGSVSVHHGHMPEITVTGPGAAEGIWAMDDYLVFPGRSPRRGFRGYGHYREVYAREDGAWRIRRLVLTRLRVDPFTVDERGVETPDPWRPRPQDA